MLYKITNLSLTASAHANSAVTPAHPKLQWPVSATECCSIFVLSKYKQKKHFDKMKIKQLSVALTGHRTNLTHTHTPDIFVFRSIIIANWQRKSLTFTYIWTSAQSNLTKGCIADLSPLAGCKWICPILTPVQYMDHNKRHLDRFSRFAQYMIHL